MNKILITLAALAAVSGAALANEKSDDSHYPNQRNGGGFVTMDTYVEQAPLAAPGGTKFKDIDEINQERRGDSSGGNNN